MSWRSEYLGALQVRDGKEKSNKALIDSYTKLADRAAALEQFSSAGTISPENAEKTAGAAVAPSGAALATMREQLVEAQRSRMELETRLAAVSDDLQQLRLRSRSETRRITELSAERATLATKLRDRDEELRGKAKFLDDIHDETVSLTLQLNMAEAQNKKLEVENKELVDRWMARMGQEADAMNVASKFS